MNPELMSSVQLREKVIEQAKRVMKKIPSELLLEQYEYYCSVPSFMRTYGENEALKIITEELNERLKN